MTVSGNDKKYANFSFKEFVNLSSRFGFTSEKVLCYPRIHREKLSNAISSYAHIANIDNSVILIDDTFWSSGKEGILILSDSIIFGKKHGSRSYGFSEIKEICYENKKVFINGKLICELSCGEVMPLACVFHGLNFYISKASSAKNLRPSYENFNEKKVAELCAFISKPEFFSDFELLASGMASGAISNVPAIKAIPGFYVADNIPSEIESMARFVLGIPDEEKYIALKDLSINDGHAECCFAVTNKGIYSVLPTIDSHDDVYIGWDELKKLSVSDFYEKGIYSGVRLSNGKAFFTCNKNVFIKPYGVKLISFLIDILRTGDFDPLSIGNLDDVEVFHERPIDEDNQKFTDEEIIIESVKSELNNENIKDKIIVDSSANKIKTLIFSAIENNKDKILPFVIDKTGEYSEKFFESDDNIAKIASFLYALLPSIARFAVSEDAFVRFIIKNKRPVIDKLSLIFGKGSAAIGDLGYESHKVEVASIHEITASGDRPARKKLVDVKLKSDDNTEKFIKGYHFFSGKKTELEHFITDYKNKDLDEDYHDAIFNFEILNASTTHFQNLIGRELGLSSEESSLFGGDAIVVEVIGYSVASIGWMLHSKVGFDRDDIADFLVPVMADLLIPYIEKVIGVSIDSRLEENGNISYLPNAKLSNSAELSGLQLNILSLGEAFLGRDTDLVVDIFFRNLMSALVRTSKIASNKVILIEKRLSQDRQLIASLIEDMDEILESIAADYLEFKNS